MKLAGLAPDEVRRRGGSQGGARCMPLRALQPLPLPAHTYAATSYPPHPGRLPLPGGAGGAQRAAAPGAGAVRRRARGRRTAHVRPARHIPGRPAAARHRPGQRTRPAVRRGGVRVCRAAGREAARSCGRPPCLLTPPGARPPTHTCPTLAQRLRPGAGRGRAADLAEPLPPDAGAGPGGSRQGSEPCAGCAALRTLRLRAQQSMLPPASSACGVVTGGRPAPGCSNCLPLLLPLAGPAPRKGECGGDDPSSPAAVAALRDEVVRLLTGGGSSLPAFQSLPLVQLEPDAGELGAGQNRCCVGAAEISNPSLGRATVPTRMPPPRRPCSDHPRRGRHHPYPRVHCGPVPRPQLSPVRQPKTHSTAAVAR